MSCLDAPGRDLALTCDPHAHHLSARASLPRRARLRALPQPGCSGPRCCANQRFSGATALLRWQSRRPRSASQTPPLGRVTSPAAAPPAWLIGVAVRLNWALQRRDSAVALTVTPATLCLAKGAPGPRHLTRGCSPWQAAHGVSAAQISASAARQHCCAQSRRPRYGGIRSRCGGPCESGRPCHARRHRLQLYQRRHELRRRVSRAHGQAQRAALLQPGLAQRWGGTRPGDDVRPRLCASERPLCRAARGRVAAQRRRAVTRHRRFWAARRQRALSASLRLLASLHLAMHKLLTCSFW